MARRGLPKDQPSLRAAGYVWLKAPGIVRLYAEGADISSRRGLFLAIPTPAEVRRQSEEDHTGRLGADPPHAPQIRLPP